MKDLNIIDCYKLTHQIPDIPEAMQLLERKNVMVVQANTRLQNMLWLTGTALLGFIIYNIIKSTSHAKKDKNKKGTQFQRPRPPYV